MYLDIIKWKNTTTKTTIKKTPTNKQQNQQNQQNQKQKQNQKRIKITNRSNVETESKSTRIHGHLLSFPGTGTSIKVAGLS